MDEITRNKKGMFIKKKVFEKRNRSVLAMNAAKQRKKDEEKMEKAYSVEGNRVVNIQELATNLECCKCKKTLSLQKIINESREGLHSTLTVVCLQCSTLNKVPTGKKIKSNSHGYSDINLSAVLGAISSGSGNTGLNKLLNCLNIPGMTTPAFKRYEREIGSALGKAAKESCMNAAVEERKLVVENIEKLCEYL